MNKQSYPQRPHRSTFDEGWLVIVLVVIGLVQVCFAFNASSGIVRAGEHAPAALQNGGASVNDQAHNFLPVHAKDHQSFQSPRLVVNL